ncbi:hypothetical protein Y032_0626g824 [Ancylostoma ceylanicum]|uniref:Protein kinase domain-containing protein n=1 Tax=Ancylostoma ceylanicum TaxID=53326 RepID=A0A016WKP8_9BILA|nr:hypothetical protein Y032_0626g824 [Ancylostoma ceylanicum]
MLDFGISKRLCPTSADEMSLGGRFKGTIRYASMACHRCQELGPRDDCESWLYMMVDLVSPMSLPWRNAKNRNDVLQIKEEVRGEKLSLFLCGLKCKDGVVKIMRYIDNLKGTDEVDYSFLLETVEQDAKRAKCDISAPYDWEFSSQEVVELIPCAEQVSWMRATVTQRTQTDEASSLRGTGLHRTQANEEACLLGLQPHRTQSEDGLTCQFGIVTNKTQSDEVIG